MKISTIILLVTLVICGMLVTQEQNTLDTTTQEKGIPNTTAQRILNYTQKFNDDENSEPLVNFDHYKDLMVEVEKHREARLINLETFRKMSEEEDVIILDARAEDLYKRRHIKGAVNLPFTKFTYFNLKRVIPNPETKILIYCNNNIQNDPINFASKISPPKYNESLMLALNIPTYINLYGYGFKNVYELDDVINILKSIEDPEYIQFEGTDFPEK